jgi:hypothetical protein
MNIGQLITYLILNSDKSNKEILAIVHSQFDCNTTMACVAWYKTKLRKEGKIDAKRSQKHNAALTQDELDELCK